MDNTQLQIVAQSVAQHLSQAGGLPMPEMRKADGTSLVSMLAVAGDTIHFTVGTLFGDEVRVTVSRAGGMFG